MKVYSSDYFNSRLKPDNSPVTEADHKAHHVIVKVLEKSGLPVLSEEGREIPWNERKKWESFWLVDPLDGTKEFIKRNGEFTVNIALVSGNRPMLGIIYAPNLDVMYAGATSTGAWRLRDYSSRNISDFDTFIKVAEPLPVGTGRKVYSVVASRSHTNEETEFFINELKKDQADLSIVSKGSALKFCLVAEGSADIYPRFGPTWEWDTGAGHAIAESAGCSVKVYDGKDLRYNRKDLLNPWFIVRRN